ncbi:tyrosine recombinase [Candidatus Neoehrlichia procyonis]|uniref:Phage integrase family protein n=1 Tax=Candidatus Neoehrlichia procyonis str. RAC413 TaxID=1359163 RepID=A0A0F3NNH3_9RICK|nr:tyrosine recombinase [Candidatus Neoehrlichia lotoris]KJV69252.1 phage integrase family protein [Candidatus Neoehrlichia lotoris str. RAC413]
MNNQYFLDIFFESLIAEKYVSFNTYKSYKVDLLGLCKFLDDNKLNITNASVESLRLYVRFLYNKKYRASSIARKISAIKSLYKFLYSDRTINYNPAMYLDTLKISSSLPKILSVDEIGKLLKTAGSDDSPEGKRMNAIINILYSSGIRVSELTHLGFYEIDSVLKEQHSEVKYLIIRGKSGKERLVLLNATAVDSIKEYVKIRKLFITKKNVDSQWLFPGAKFDQCITRQRIGQLLKELANKSGMDSDIVSPHKVRHSFATHLLNNGSNIVFIQKMLGHSNLSTTQIYTYVANDRLRDVLLKYHPLAKNIK